MSGKLQRKTVNDLDRGKKHSSTGWEWISEASIVCPLLKCPISDIGNCSRICELLSSSTPHPSGNSHLHRCQQFPKAHLQKFWRIYRRICSVQISSLNMMYLANTSWYGPMFSVFVNEVCKFLRRTKNEVFNELCVAWVYPFILFVNLPKAYCLMSESSSTCFKHVKRLPMPFFVAVMMDEHSGWQALTYVHMCHSLELLNLVCELTCREKEFTSQMPAYSWTTMGFASRFGRVQKMEKRHQILDVKKFVHWS